MFISTFIMNIFLDQEVFEIRLSECVFKTIYIVKCLPCN